MPREIGSSLTAGARPEATARGLIARIIIRARPCRCWACQCAPCTSREARWPHPLRADEARLRRRRQHEDHARRRFTVDASRGHRASSRRARLHRIATRFRWDDCCVRRPAVCPRPTPLAPERRIVYFKELFSATEPPATRRYTRSLGSAEGSVESITA